jgi:hypothetical protein
LNEKARKLVTKKIADRFKIKILGNVKKYVGIEVVFNENGSIAISQPTYVLAMLERYNMTSCNPTRTPASPGQMELPNGSPDAPGDRDSSKIPYRSAVGSLLYAARGTRPDIELSVNLASQFNSCYTQTHWQWVKRIFRYLRGAVSDAIIYYKTALTITTYCGSDWAGCKNTRRSRSGWVIYLAGGAVIWQSQKQESTSLSSCEAEFYAIVEVIKDLLWLCGFLKELKVQFNGPFLFMDNDAARALAQRYGKHRRTKHIDVKFMFIREVFERGQVKPIRVQSADNNADFFTKILPEVGFTQKKRKVVDNEPQERCNLARTKRTLSGIRRRQAFLERIRRGMLARMRAQERSTNPYGCSLRCAYCPTYIWYLKHDRNLFADMWATSCFACDRRKPEVDGPVPFCNYCNIDVSLATALLPDCMVKCSNDSCSNFDARPRRTRNSPDRYRG